MVQRKINNTKRSPISFQRVGLEQSENALWRNWGLKNDLEFKKLLK